MWAIFKFLECSMINDEDILRNIFSDFEHLNVMYAS